MVLKDPTGLCIGLPMFMHPACLGHGHLSNKSRRRHRPHRVLVRRIVRSYDVDVGDDFVYTAVDWQLDYRVNNIRKMMEEVPLTTDHP